MVQGVRERVEGRTVAVAGLGRAGMAAARLLHRAGARLRLLDEAPAERLGLERLREAEGLGEVRLGPLERGVQGAELVIVSPGIRPASWEREIEASGGAVVSDVEVAAWALRGATVVAITGTNGKSTVTTVVGAACRGTARPTFVGGNLGRPAAELLEEPGAAAEGGFVVLELSSFQLARTRSLRADVAVLLNLAPDHLDWHGSLRAYEEAKGRLFRMQRPGAHAVVPAGERRCAQLASAGPARLHVFGDGAGEVRLQGERLLDEVAGWSLPLESLRIVGRHQQIGLAAAALAARLAGVGAEQVQRALREAEGLPHRVQPVGTVRGVRFVDDSKATNVAAAVAGLRGVAAEGPVVLLAGGRAKGEAFEPLARAVAELGAGAVLFGEAQEPLARAMEAARARFERAGTLAEAVRRAFALAGPGATVLLSPACASFDAFGSYAERGEAFAREVGRLALEVAGEPGAGAPGTPGGTTGAGR